MTKADSDIPAMRQHNLFHPLLKGNVKEMPISVLAWIGDSIFDLHIRMQLVSEHATAKSGYLHGRAVQQVSAHAQAQALEAIRDKLSEAELQLIRRARNSDPGSMPRHASPVMYRQATALEALFGFLYLSNADDRLQELISLIIADQREASSE